MLKTLKLRSWDKKPCAECTLNCDHESSSSALMRAGYSNDLTSPLKRTQAGNSYILDGWSFLQMGYCKRNRYSLSCSIVPSDWSAHHGGQYQIHSDGDIQFESSLRKELCRPLGISKSQVITYYPQGKRQIEWRERKFEELFRSS